uniref:Ribosomal protein L6 n=1 Tax=Micractinium conductrix TaxID=554055 RepID=A0A2I4S767_9CHLO|nr:ribosomal protein L6 [Micractinium conductrix]
MKSSFYYHSFQLPEKVTIEKKQNLLKFSGPLGSTYLNLNKIDPEGLGGISLNPEKNKVELLSPSKAFFGLFKKLIENKIIGVSRGFLIYLKIVGIGYRASLQNESLLLKLGYSHDILYQIPLSIKIFLVDPTLICLFGIDKNQVTQIAAKIRKLRKPSAYKGKGIRLINEKILLKQGKKK